MTNLEKAIELLNELQLETSNASYLYLDVLDSNVFRLQNLLERVKALIQNTFNDAELKRQYLNKCEEIDREISSRVFLGLSDFIDRKRKLLRFIDIVTDVLRTQDDPEIIHVKPLWKGRNFEVEQDLCFLLMPFTEDWSDAVWDTINEIVSEAGMRCERADQKDGRIIMEDIWSGICRARIVIADLTAKNPNVTYEVGLADVLGKDVILLSQTPNDVPFDFKGLRLIVYENTIAGVRKLTKTLEKRLKKLA